MGLAFSFIPSSMIILIIKERETNSKHQQFVSGMSVGSYWISNFIIDYTKYIIVGLGTFFLILAFDVSSVIEDDKWVMTLLLLVFYGFAFIPFVYFLSFIFKSPT